MRSYVGPLLDPLVTSEDFAEDAPVHPCEVDSHGWGHSAAIHMTINSICLGQRVRLVRRKMSPTREEVPGEIVGDVIGSSHQAGGLIYLGVQLDSGEVVGVDVSDPGDWAWEVS